MSEHSKLVRTSPTTLTFVVRPQHFHNRHLELPGSYLHHFHAQAKLNQKKNQKQQSNQTNKAIQIKSKSNPNQIQIKSNPIQSNPIQFNPNPIQSNPIQSKSKSNQIKEKGWCVVRERGGGWAFLFWLIFVVVFVFSHQNYCVLTNLSILTYHKHSPPQTTQTNNNTNNNTNTTQHKQHSTRMSLQLKLCRHLWGVTESLSTFIPQAKAKGYEVIDTPLAFMNDQQKDELKHLVQKHNMQLVLSVFTDMFELHNGVEVHTKSFYQSVKEAAAYKPLLINSHSLRDHFPLSQAVKFFKEAIQIEKDVGCSISHETHRGRFLFTPWNTKEVLKQVPELKITMDFSHWVNVCERIPVDQEEATRLAADHCHHIHARVGYSNGPQVSDPRAPEFTEEVAAHDRVWGLCWESQKRRGLPFSTLTPEYGPNPYIHQLPYTQAPTINLEEVCDSEAVRLKKKFLEKFR